jgi:hypothetical protein
MAIKPLAPKEEIPVIGSDISNATIFSVLNNSGAACQIRIDNGDLLANQPVVALAIGERVDIVKNSDDTVYAENLSGASVTDVFATKIAYGN